MKQKSKQSYHVRVSIGLPVYNGENFLGEALESLLSQTFHNFELIISDNASTDGTKAICEAYANRDPRIQYYRQQRNIGGAGNFGFVFQLAKSEYFKWATHDDVLHPEFLAECISALNLEPAAVLCQSLLNYIDSEGNELGIYNSNLGGTDSIDPAKRFCAVVLLPHPNYEMMGVFRRSALVGSLLLKSFHGNDKALLAEMALRGKFAQVKRPLLFVRDHTERYTRSKIHPKERLVWYDSSLAGRISLPTWRLYFEYLKMIPRNVKSKRIRVRCYGHLVRWWGCNWNAAKMVVDLLGVPFPGVVGYAERFKKSYIAPAPGVDQVRKQRRISKP